MWICRKQGETTNFWGAVEYACLRRSNESISLAGRIRGDIKLVKSEETINGVIRTELTMHVDLLSHCLCRRPPSSLPGEKRERERGTPSSDKFVFVSNIVWKYVKNDIKIMATLRHFHHFRMWGSWLDLAAPTRHFFIAQVSPLSFQVFSFICNRGRVERARVHHNSKVSFFSTKFQVSRFLIFKILSPLKRAVDEEQKERWPFFAGKVSDSRNSWLHAASWISPPATTPAKIQQDDTQPRLAHVECGHLGPCHLSPRPQSPSSFEWL